MPTHRSMNVNDRLQREYHAAVGDENPALYRSAALAIERLRRTDPPEDAFWIALAERLHRKDHRVAWMLAAHDGSFHTAVVRQHYNAAFDDTIETLEITTMAKKQHFENGEVRDGVESDECPNGCGPDEACSECPDSKFEDAEA